MVKTKGILAAALSGTLALSATTTSATAATILPGSVLNFAGQSTCTATGCTFGNASVMSGSGSFSSFAYGTAATFFPITFNPFTPGQTYTTTDSGGRVASFFATGQTSSSVSNTNGLTSYSFNDTGTARLTGFDDTPGFYLFTANQDGTAQGSFSATAVTTASAAPEPGTWAMMIVGFGIAGAAMRRRRNSSGSAQVA